MGGFFNYDSPLLSGLGKLTDLVVLNLLTLLFCIPIVTIGASLTACHYVALKIRRGEGYVMSNFWKSFKMNLKQSTVIWFVLFVGVMLCLYIGVFFDADGMLISISRCINLVAAIYLVLISCWIFPLQSKFDNTVKNTFMNSFLMAFKYLFRTLLMVLIYLIPVGIVLLLKARAFSLLFLFGLSVPIYLCAMLYDKKFEELEEMIMQKQVEEVEETERIEEGAN